MKLPKLTSFFLIFFFLASFLAQARRLQENYDYGKLPAGTSDLLLTLRLELPTSLSLQDSQSFFERFNGVVTYMLTLSSLRSKEFGRGANSPPPAPETLKPDHPKITTSGYGRPASSPPPAPETENPDQPRITTSGYGRPARSPPPAPETHNPDQPRITTSGYGRPARSPPPAPETHNPDHPRITTPGYGRPPRSPPPAPTPGAPIHPVNSGGSSSGGAQVISSANPIATFVASA